MRDLDAAREVLSSAVYESAFGKVMTGNDDQLTDEERESIRKAKDSTGHDGPGYPAPVQMDRSWPGEQA